MSRRKKYGGTIVVRKSTRKNAATVEEVEIRAATRRGLKQAIAHAEERLREKYPGKPLRVLICEGRKGG